MAQIDPERMMKIDQMIYQWDKVLDNARYLGVEHRHKEKEYGIKWRETFKIELDKEYSKLKKKFKNPIPPKENLEDPEPLEVIQAIVEKEFKDMETFRFSRQYELIELMEENL